ncbi:hypothetical protein [Nocardia jiangxiensis]|uniref:Uncharacterized protein n=1 Tax=Nocardia jiangxiensis TaxID=282685 RepID=A0ABW6RXN2_9NOCA|nr:hypothetical protein [Nocardia jiangxiensis]
MAECRTREQVEVYLAQIFNPDRRFQPYPIGEIGWLVLPEQSPEEINPGGTNLVIDAETGVVIEYPSWSTTMIADDFREAKATGRHPAGGQIYPPLWRLSIQRTQETPETIGYRVQALSQANPPEGSEEYEITIDKQTLRRRGYGQRAGSAVARAEWQSRQDGSWPERLTWEE